MKIRRIIAFAAAITVAGCITINVHVSFPEAQFQEMADRIVDEVQGHLDGAPDVGPEGALPARHIASWSFISLAYADDIDITVENPEIEAIKEKMKRNFEEYKPFKNNGSAGENLRGYLMERLDGSEELSLDKEKQLRKLIQRENADRKDLYLALRYKDPEEGEIWLRKEEWKQR